MRIRSPRYMCAKQTSSVLLNPGPQGAALLRGLGPCRHDYDDHLATHKNFPASRLEYGELDLYSFSAA